MMRIDIYLELVLIVTLLAASGFDLAQRRIPNRLLMLSLPCALVLHLLSGEPANVLSIGLAGFATGLFLFLPLYLLRGMAAGDVKLMATVGAFSGPLMAAQICLASYCIGGILAVLIVIFKRCGREAAANIGALLRPLLMRVTGMPQVAEPMPNPSVGTMPYALAITLGTFLVLSLQYM